MNARTEPLSQRVELCFTVPGIPQPQASVRSLGKGRPSIHGNAERLLPWRAAVTAHCRQAILGRRWVP